MTVIELMDLLLIAACKPRLSGMLKTAARIELMGLMMTMNELMDLLLGLPRLIAYRLDDDG